MRFVRFESAGGSRWGIVEGEQVREIEGDILERWRATEKVVSLAGLKLLPPCQPSKIVALGLNYKSHAREVNLPIPEEPAIFLKPSTALIGPGDPIRYPKRCKRLDYEAELACVIKKPAHRVSQQEALTYVWGYMCLNDVTARDIQFTGGNFLNLTWSKGYDSFCPVGPYVVVDEINPGRRACRVLRQRPAAAVSLDGRLHFSDGRADCLDLKYHDAAAGRCGDDGDSERD